MKFYTKVEPYVHCQQFFVMLGKSKEVSEELVDGTEKFLCDTYNKAKVRNLSDARYTIFREKHASKRETDLLVKIKGSDLQGKFLRQRR